MLMILVTFIYNMKDACQMASAHGIYEHVRGTINHMHKLELLKRKKILTSSRFNSTPLKVLN